MFTVEQIRHIKAMNTSFSTEYIQSKAAEWEQCVKRIKSSRKDLSKIRLVPEEGN